MWIKISIIILNSDENVSAAENAAAVGGNCDDDDDDGDDDDDDNDGDGDGDGDDDDHHHHHYHIMATTTTTTTIIHMTWTIWPHKWFAQSFLFCPMCTLHRV